MSHQRPTLHDGSNYLAVPIHTDFGDLDPQGHNGIK